MEEEEIRRLHIDLLYQTVAINHLSPQVNGGTDLKRFKGKCRNYLRTPVELVGENCEELLEEMEKKGHIGIGDYKVLKDLVSFSDPLVREVESVESDIMELMEKKKTRKWKASDSTDDSSQTKDGEPDISKLKQKLIKINSDTTKVIPISPLNKGRKYKMPVELLYASVVIREEQTDQEKEGNSPRDSYIFTNADTDSLSSYTSSQHYREIKDPSDIFKKDSEVARNIYMLGDAAHGKTTYCMWLLKKWCNIAQPADCVGSKELDDLEKVLQKFDFLFLVQFRYVYPNRASVIEMICQDVFARYTEYHTAIRHVLSSQKYRSLIIMDGLDEWNPNEKTRKQLTCQGIPNIPVSSSVSCFLSMRPWVFSKFSDMVEVGDSVIEIHGLSETGMKKVIKNVLLNYFNLRENSSKFEATYENIIGHLAEKSLKSFMKIPLLAVVCVQIWYKGEQVGDSMTSFYAVMVDMLIERADHKRKPDKTVDCKLRHILSGKENITNHISVLLKLGKVAYEGLLSNETNLVFQKRKLQKEIGKEELQFALDVGLISQKEASSLTEKNVSVHFFHKSIQEFLAVIYIVTNKEVSDLFCEHLSNVKVIMELSNVIKFICGICPSRGSVISQRVVSVTDSDGEICEYREVPVEGNNTVEELYKLQVSWYRELQYGQTYSSVTHTNRPVTQTDRPVTFHVSDVYLDRYSDTETVRGVRELLSDHHVDIRSLTLWCVPTDGERGITNTVLCDFLSDTHRTRSLVRLYIEGGKTGRSVPTPCVPTLKCLHLEYVTINTDLGGNVCPPLLTDMSQLRDLWLMYMTLGEGGLGLSPDMVHIEKVELWYVNMPAAGWGEFVRSVSHIQHRFNVILYNTNIDEVSVTKIRSSPDFTVTQDDDVDVYGRYRLNFTRVWPPSQLTQGNVLLYTRLSPLS